MVGPWHLWTPPRTQGLSFLLSSTAHGWAGTAEPGLPQPAVHPQPKTNPASESTFAGTVQVKRENVQNSSPPDQTSNSLHAVHRVRFWKMHLTTLSPSVNRGACAQGCCGLQTGPVWGAPRAGAGMPRSLRVFGAVCQRTAHRPGPPTPSRPGDSVRAAMVSEIKTVWGRGSRRHRPVRYAAQVTLTHHSSPRANCNSGFRFSAQTQGIFSDGLPAAGQCPELVFYDSCDLRIE